MTPEERTELDERIRQLRGPTKRCGACASDHPIEQFALKSAAKLTLHSRCKAAQRNVSTAWYQANADKHRTAAATRRKAIAAAVSEVVDEWLSGRRCTRCGGNDRLVATGPTGTSLKRLVKDGWSLDSIAALLPDATVSCQRCQRTLRDLALR